MPNQSPPTRYSAVAQGFHWIIAALIVVQFTLGWTAGFLPIGARKLARLDWHKSFGMTILTLAVLRLLWRLFPPPPGLPPRLTQIGPRAPPGTQVLFSFFLFGLALTR